MSSRLTKYRHVPTWEKAFLMAIRQGYNEKTAANTAGVGTAMVQERAARDSEFKKNYDDAIAGQKVRPSGGMF
jgi:hypothetical protein